MTAFADEHLIHRGFIMILVTVGLGIVLSLVIGTRIAPIGRDSLDATGQFRAVGEALVGAVLRVWGVRRMIRPPAPPAADTKRRGTSLLALSGLGLLYGLSSALDPTFIALIVLAGRHGSFLDAGIAHLLWILISPFPLVIVLGAMIAGRHHMVIERLRSWWERARPVLSRVGTALALLSGAILMVDAGWWFVTGAFFIQL